MQYRLLRRSVLFCAPLLLLFAGCQPAPPASGPPKSTEGSADSTSPATVSTAAPRKVTLLLNWFPEAEHGGFYAALVHGFYKDQGLEVTIQAGGPKAPVIQSVASGQVDFGVENADTLLLGRAQQADVVAVLAPIQDSPRCIMVHKGSGIDTFEKLAADKSITLAINPGQAFADFLKSKLPLGEHKVVRYPGNVAQFLADPKFATQAYNFSEPFFAKQQGGDPAELMVSDLGFNTYTSLLVCTQDLINKDPDVVTKMVRASQLGWIKYLSDPTQTNAYINSINAEATPEILQYGVEMLKPLCQPDGLPAEQIGVMTQERWSTLANQLVEIGSVPAGTVDATKAFTTSFFEKPQPPSEGDPVSNEEPVGAPESKEDGDLTPPPSADPASPPPAPTDATPAPAAPTEPSATTDPTPAEPAPDAVPPADTPGADAPPLAEPAPPGAPL